MSKCISCGNWNKKYWYIFLSIILLLIYQILLGYTFDEDKKYEINFFTKENFSQHYLIHQLTMFLFCMAFSYFLYDDKKLEQAQNQNLGNKKTNNKMFIFSNNITGSLVEDHILIYRENYEARTIKNSKFFAIMTILSLILLEQVKNIFTKFFVHMDFWMIELYILAFLNLRIFKIEIYRHQMLGFGINLFSFLLKFITAIITIVENKEEKALYVKYWWTFFIAIIIYFLYSYLLSYTLINMKKLFELKFIPIYVILLIYGAFGFLLSLIIALITTFIKCKSEVSNYICKVKDENNQTFYENFEVYFASFNHENNDKIAEELVTVFSSISYGFYKFCTFKIFEYLTPLHFIFSNPVYYFFLELFFLCVKGYRIFADDNIILIIKLFIVLASDILSLIGYLIYIEIIEINAGGFNYNLRKNIMKRAKREVSKFESENILGIEEEDSDNNDNENENEISNDSDLEIYE